MLERCDRCDGNHATHSCRFFDKERESHPDALIRKCTKRDRGSAPRVSRGTVVPQPRDGSCLFHSLAYGLTRTHTIDVNANRLRFEIGLFIGKFPHFQVADSPISDWIEWSCKTDAKTYAKSIAWTDRWGGGIELAVCSHLFNVNIHVYQREGTTFRCISSFGNAVSENTINVLYVGRSHYDALTEICYQHS